MAMNAAIPDQQASAIKVAEPTDQQPPTYAYEPDELNLAQIVRFFRRHWRLICGTALAAGLTTALYLALFVARSYEASATLVIVSPKLSSELKPPTLTVQGYQKLLESGAVLAETTKRLVQQSVLAEGDTLALGRVETRIFVSRQSETTSLAPMLQTVARGQTPEQAAAIANTWAQVFLERIRDLMAGTTSATVQFIEAQYPQARERLAQLENEQATAANALQKRSDEAATRGDEKSLTFQNETADLVAASKAETRRLLEDFSGSHNLETRNSEQDAQRQAYGDLQGEQARVSPSRQYQQLELAATRQQLAGASPYLTLQKAITDDALWQTLAQEKDHKSAEVDWQALQGRSLLTQELNPVYSELSARKAQLEREVSALIPRAARNSRRNSSASARSCTISTSLSPY